MTRERWRPMRSVRFRCPFPPCCRPGERRRSLRPLPCAPWFSFVRTRSSRRPCLRSRRRRNATARHSGRRRAGHLGNRQKDRPRASAFVRVEWRSLRGVTPREQTHSRAGRPDPQCAKKTDQAHQHLEALGEAMKQTDARTRAEMGRFRSAQRTPAYSLPAHAYPRACSLPARGHAVCQSCTRISKGVGFQSLRAHALEPANAWVRAISAQRQDTPHHTKGVRVMG